MRSLRCVPLAFWLAFVVLGGALLLTGWVIGRGADPLPRPQYQVDSFALSELVPVVLDSARAGRAGTTAALVADRCSQIAGELEADGRDGAASAYEETARWARTISDEQAPAEQYWRAEVLAAAITGLAVGNYAVIPDAAWDGYVPPTTTTTIAPAAERIQGLVPTKP